MHKIALWSPSWQYVRTLVALNTPDDQPGTHEVQMKPDKDLNDCLSFAAVGALVKR